MAETPLLRVKNLKKYFPIRGGLFSREVARGPAVDDLSMEILKGETLGLLRGARCGKSTTGRCILRLIEPTAGEVWFEDKNVTTLDKRSLRQLRRDMQIIFQDPYASLNPRMTVGSIIGEALVIHKLAKTKREREERVVHLLETVGLSADHLRRYPHEFSGGRRRRLGIARPPPRRPPTRCRSRGAGLGARRVDPGPGHQPPGGSPEAVQLDLPVHRPRPVGGRAHLDARRRHVPRHARGDRACEGAVQQSEASVHGSAPLSRA